MLLACLCLILCLFVFSLLAPCDVALDLYLAIDSTKTLGQNGHNTMKTWAEKLVDLFNIGTTRSSGLTEVEVIQFWGSKASESHPDSHAVVDIPLGDYANKADLEKKIKSLKYHNGESTIIPHVLALLNSEISNPAPRKTFVLVLTDGVDDSTQRNLGTIHPRPGNLTEEANELKEKENVTVFAIGFQGTMKSEPMNVTNLEIIASPGNVITAGGDVGAALNKPYNKMMKALCPN